MLIQLAASSLWLDDVESSWQDVVERAEIKPNNQCMKLRCIPTVVKFLEVSVLVSQSGVIVRDFMDFTRTHLIRVQVSMPWPGTLSLTALTILHTGFYPLPSNYFTPQLPNKPSPCPRFPPFLHMKEANHRCDLPLFTSDPPDTRITTSIPAPQPLDAFLPQLGGCFSPCRWQMRGQGVVRPPC